MENKETVASNGTLDQMDLIDILKSISTQTSRIYIILKRTWNIF